VCMLLLLCALWFILTDSTLTGYTGLHCKR